MAVFQVKCANKRVIIYEFDHQPPHCHVIMNGGDVKVLLETLEVFGTKVVLTAALRKCLKKHRNTMLAAWERVTVSPIPSRRR